MSTQQLDRRAVFERFYEFSGRVLAVGSADDESAGIITEFLRGYLLRKVPGPSPLTPACRLHVSQSSPPPLPEGLQSFAVPRGSCHTDLNSYYLTVDDSRVDIAPPPHARVDVWLGDTRLSRHTVALDNVLSYATQAALRRCAIFDFHAAGLAEPRTGAGFLLVGPPDSGKSTLTVRLVTAGWRYLTDDSVALSETPDGVTAAGLRRPFAVTAKTLEGFDLPRLSEALGDPVPSNRLKRRLDPKVVFPGSRAESCAPRVLCFPRVVDDEASRAEPMSRAEAMSLLIKYNPWAGYDVTAARDHLRVLGRLVAQTKPLRLLSGRDILRDARAADALLAPHAEGRTA